MTKYIFVTGGVVSSIGKGIATASLGRLLRNRGFRICLQKLDPYLTRSEGETMQEAARQVFKEKLNALRVQFTLAYQDQRLTEAQHIGIDIAAESRH